MTSHQVQLLFVDIAAVLLLAKVFGAVAARLRQPPVVGEIVAGIALGPTLLHHTVVNSFFPSDVVTPLSALADVGVALFMFTIGLETDLGRLRARLPQALGTGLGSMLLPFAGGLVLACCLLRDPGRGPHAAFVVFIALSLSVTAFPVLARILADNGLTSSEEGLVAIAAAAVVDSSGWVALALVQAAMSLGSGSWRLVLLPLLVPLLFRLRPTVARFVLPGAAGAGPGKGRTAVALSGVLLAGAAGESMGLHFIFGAFLFGLVTPRGADEASLAFRADLLACCRQLAVLLLPLYFLVSGLQVDLSQFRARQLADLGAVLVVATGGKLVGGYLGGRCSGLSRRPAATVAALMNTRGLTELIFLGVGRQLGLLDRTLYSTLVLMAVITTVLTGPLLALLRRRGPQSGPRPRSGPRAQPVPKSADVPHRAAASASAAATGTPR